MKTFKFRLKNTNEARLNAMALSVNYVWNYCNETSMLYIDKRERWISGFELGKLTTGCSIELKLGSQSIQAVCQEYALRRRQFKKRKLAWRSEKRSLGWIPFNGQTLKVKGDLIIYNTEKFRFWNSRDIKGKIKSGNFSQDSRGRWYICFSCEETPSNQCRQGEEIGIDLGLKTLATCSNGNKSERGNLTALYADRLAISQRARKWNQVKKIGAKIKNTRKDWNHKETTKLVKSYSKIIIGNVSSVKLVKTTMAKSVLDAGWAQFKTMLAYKAIRLGVEYKEVNEMFSTVTCSSCFERTGPSGLRALGVREWTCKCGVLHDRDVNAAKNILRFGHESLIKGNPIEVSTGGCQGERI